jgi:phosphoribosylformimino-5-aminoimidazole carboxamide ribonucleotide (ProFAR) isomerase
MVFSCGIHLPHVREGAQWLKVQDLRSCRKREGMREERGEKVITSTAM